MTCMAGTMIIPTYAADNISVTYNGGYTQFTENMGSPYVESNRVLVPLRAVSEGMNKKVDWNATIDKLLYLITQVM